MTNVLNQKSIEAKPVILSGAYFSGVEGPAFVRRPSRKLRSVKGCIIETHRNWKL
jgi:hypothetical protein